MYVQHVTPCTSLQSVHHVRLFKTDVEGPFENERTVEHLGKYVTTEKKEGRTLCLHRPPCRRKVPSTFISG